MEARTISLENLEEFTITKKQFEQGRSRLARDYIWENDLKMGDTSPWEAGGVWREGEMSETRIVLLHSKDTDSGSLLRLTYEPEFFVRGAMNSRGLIEVSFGVRHLPWILICEQMCSAQ